MRCDICGTEKNVKKDSFVKRCHTCPTCAEKTKQAYSDWFNFIKKCSNATADSALLLKTDLSIVEIKPSSDNKKFSLKELQNAVEGYIEFMPSKYKNVSFIVNEEGLLKGLKENKLYDSFDIFRDSYFNNAIYGNVLIIPSYMLK